MASVASAVLPFFLVSGIVLPTALAAVWCLMRGLRELDEKWRSKQEWRRRKQQGSTVRFLFDKRGVALEETLLRSLQLERLDHVVGLLRTLGGGPAFGNQTIYKHHSVIRQTMQVADRSYGAARNFLCFNGADQHMMGILDGVEPLLVSLAERKESDSGDLSRQLGAFAGDLAVLHAAFGTGSTTTALGPNDEDKAVAAMQQGVADALLNGGTDSRGGPDFPAELIPMLAKRAVRLRLSFNGKLVGEGGPRTAALLEPTVVACGVCARSAFGPLALAAQLSDKYSLDDCSVLLTAVALWLAVGPVRFVGKIPAVLAVIGLVGAFVLEVLMYREKKGPGSPTWLLCFSRLAVPLILGLALILPVLIDLGPSQTDAELEGRHTFLHVPPQYQLGLVNGQDLYVSIIFGIMHANLFILCLLPLPLCFFLQAQILQVNPGVRFWLPQRLIWVHRLLGYVLLAGLLAVALVWLTFQGAACLFSGQAQTCLAFAPGNQLGKDVFVLRFHIVWPAAFFFLPLMMFDQCPIPSAASAGLPLKAEAAALCADKRAASFGNAAAEERSQLLGAADGVAAKPPADSPLEWRSLLAASPLTFTDSCLFLAAISGCCLVLHDGSFIPLWPVVVVLMPLTTCSRLRRRGEWPDFLRRFWREAACSCHAFAFSIMMAAALYYRLQVFWPTLLPWGLYVADRWLAFRSGCRNTSHILVGQHMVSSYAVSKQNTKTGVVEPSHVRLVVAKPPGFTFKEGQWVYLALPSHGTHFGAAPFCAPLLRWHPFSIASAEHDDYLEFHIRVHDAPNIAAGNDVTMNVASDGTGFAKLSRPGRWLEWLFPHRIPCMGVMPETSWTGSKCRTQPAGVYLKLCGGAGTSLKVLQPQAQWTGQLWNLVQWLVENPSTQESGCEATRAPPDLDSGHIVRIMGPFGSLPYTCEAHPALMLIGAGVGFPSTGSMLRRILSHNLGSPCGQQKAVCFMWSAASVDQLLLCFPSLLADLAKYVNRSSIQDLQQWLTIKIFIAEFRAGDFLTVDPGPRLVTEGVDMEPALEEVRRWLLGRSSYGSVPSQEREQSGTYIAQGSLGANFADILRCSVFIRDKVVGERRSLGVLFCGPMDLCSWIKSDFSNTTLPVRTEFACECSS
mmetsp:Transcript_76986/g.152490  ORF Transcript_76986/g.152490 Transcript_76986/m.152490 type:complete len:1129 (-) Transcript_76986:56-3442(-)